MQLCSAVTINGGGGNDVLSFSGTIAITGAVNYVNGGAGKDTIGLGTVHSGTNPGSVRCIQRLQHLGF